MSAPDESPTERQPAKPAPDESPTERQPATWVGSAAVPDGERTRRRPRSDDTLDLPVHERLPPEPEIRYVPVPVPVPVPAYAPPPGPRPPRGYRPPPGHQRPPPGYPAAPKYRVKRRRRKWPWVLTFFTLLCLGCCGGCFAWAKPFYDQYPASAATSAAVTGLAVVDDTAAKRTAERLHTSIDSGQVDEARFTVVYADKSNRQSRVTVFGTTRFVTDPKKDLDTGLGKLAGDLQLTGLRAVDAGTLGGEQRCGTGRLDGKAVSLCAWADHGSLGVALFANRTVEASTSILQNIRASIIQRG